MPQPNKKTQAWSMDIILAVVIFIGAFFLYYTLVGSNPSSKAGALKDDATSIIKQVANDGNSLRVLDSRELNESRLGELKNLNYEQLKGMFRTEGDFCIYIEDDQGNIVLINKSYRGIGSSNINISGIPCSQK
ncbi:MAG TPA: hypothetical protein VJJ52_01760 [Candidatus Nanoarchaeia archaeon]|nr:hypothetical protein [Candidatus Nanoarchaeia archaeon]